MDGWTGGERAALAGVSVAFTGRLASMSRAEAAKLVARHGGTLARSVTRTTGILVVGAEGAPFRADGRLTRKLARAEALVRRGFEIEVLPEETFLDRLGLVPTGVLGLHPLPKLAELLGIPVRQVRGLIRAGLVRSVESRDGVPLFDFRSVSGARSVVSLLSEGVPARTILRSFARVKGWLPSEDVTEALGRLSVVKGLVVLRDAAGRWLEPGGQLVLDFDAENGSGPAVVPLMRPSEDLFIRALDFEARGDLHAAADLYRRILLEEGPDADTAFNLGNVLYALGQPDAAEERFRQAAELDVGRADAWFNLGNILADRGETADAIEAFRIAVNADPSYAEARSSVADTLEQVGRSDEARPHWRAYLDLDPHGPWADYALRRLAERPAS